LVCIHKADKDRLSDVVRLRCADVPRLRRIYRATADQDRIGKDCKHSTLEAGGRTDWFLESTASRADYAREIDSGRTPHNRSHHVNKVTYDGGWLTGDVQEVKLGLIRDYLAWRGCECCERGQKSGQNCRFQTA
jgi:hypothetical protein